jgi:class 3 adenylate cyclase
MEEITNKTVLPTYDIFAYTTGKPSKIDMKDKVLSKVNALEYVLKFKNGTYRKSPVYKKESGECKFYHPVTFGRKAGRKLVGFSVVTYREEVLMKKYYQTKVFVIAMSVLFLYFGFFITLFLSDIITNPLLFLRSKVRKTSNSIKEIVSGSANIKPENFEYEDCIKTNDEIKDLSTEIGNLVSLIRGIVPYISFSTLKNAERESKRSYSRELCFLFTDIRGFTSMCEGLPPKDVVNILNHYLDIETQIILKNGGDVDKFVGDEMMAFFAGPKKEYNACKAAMEIRVAMREEQKKSLQDESTFVSMGIGINTGKVVFGPIGSSSRMDFTSIGDTVNLAARLESANKVYGSKSIITEAVYQKLHDSFICRELDYITVKGKTEPVIIYEILQEKSKAEEKIYEIKENFEKGLELYRAQQWKEAFTQFQLNVKKYIDILQIV